MRRPHGGMCNKNLGERFNFYGKSCAPSLFSIKKYKNWDFFLSKNSKLHIFLCKKVDAALFYPVKKLYVQISSGKADGIWSHA